MKKKLIYAMSASLLLGGLTFGFNNSEVRAQDEFESAYPCKNGVVKGKKGFGVCYSQGPDCFRCKLF
jgi:hypothetical protein